MELHQNRNKIQPGNQEWNQQQILFIFIETGHNQETNNNVHNFSIGLSNLWRFEFAASTL